MPGGRTKAPATKPVVPGKRGRPSSLTEDTIKIIRARILACGSYADAAISAGIDPSTFQRWKNKGEADFAANRASDYRDFYLLVVQANLDVKTILQGRVYAKSFHDGRLALKILERRWPDEWGLKIKVEDTSPRKPAGGSRDRFMKRVSEIEERQARALKALRGMLDDNDRSRDRDSEER